MPDDRQFHFRIRVGDVEVEASGPEEYVKSLKEYADQLISSSSSRMRTMGAVTPSTPSTSEQVKSTPPSTGQPLGKDESIVEFLERLPNKTHQDKILAFGYFLEKNRATTSFGVKEINDCYEEVKEARSNTAQYLALLTKSGLIMKAKSQVPGSPSQYVLTRKGEKTIDSGFSPTSEQ
jgi:hypothetical protein